MLRVGEWVLFDDACLHEASNDSNVYWRSVLVLDLWHPDLTVDERRVIERMFRNELNE